MAYTTFNINTPVYQFNVDREKAESLNVPVASVFTALQTFLAAVRSMTSMLLAVLGK